MINYHAIKESLRSDELGEYVAYGIAAFKTENSECKKLAFISDIFTDKDQAEKTAQLFTNMGLDPDHLYDVVTDIIGIA